MNGHGKSDGPIVPAKLPNNGGPKRNRSYGEPHTGTKVETPDTAKGAPKDAGEAAEPAAEGVEGKGSAEGSLRRQNMSRAQDRTGMHSALERIGRAARRDKTVYRLTL